MGERETVSSSDRAKLMSDVSAMFSAEYMWRRHPDSISSKASKDPAYEGLRSAFFSFRASVEQAGLALRGKACLYEDSFLLAVYVWASWTREAQRCPDLNSMGLDFISIAIMNQLAQAEGQLEDAVIIAQQEAVKSQNQDQDQDQNASTPDAS